MRSYAVATRSLPVSGYGPRGFDRVIGDMTFVATKSDFPAPVAGVITLPAESSWFITGPVDLEGDRLVCMGDVAITGISPETCVISSAGLASGQYLLSTAYSISLRFVALDVDAGRIAVEVNSDGSAAVDWVAVNFTGAGRAVELTDVDNVVLSIMAFFGDGIHLLGSVNTLAVTESIFVSGTGAYGIYVDAAASINRRLRLGDCSAIAFATGVALSVPAATVVNAEGFILDYINFSGGATYVTGTTYLQDVARWQECRGITNTTRLAVFYMAANGTPTTIASAGTYYKAEGATTASGVAQRFTFTDNRATYASELIQAFFITATASATSGTSKEIAIKVVKNGTTDIDAAPILTTTRTTGKAADLSFQGAVLLQEGDYLEVWVTNATDTTAVTVTDLNFAALPL